MNPTSRTRGSRRVASTASSGSVPSLIPTASASQKPDAPTQHEIKMLFKKLCRRYLKFRRPPSDEEMEPLWRMREYVDVEDIRKWRDEIGVKKGVIFDDGKVIFDEWPDSPHEEIISEFNAQFIEFGSIYRGTPHYPVFVNQGASDVSIPGSGRDKQPDAAWLPSHRPQNPLPNALAPLLPQQPNGDPFPSLILEVGHSQSIPDLIRIRDRMLSPQTAINVFVLIAYNRNSTRQNDMWYMQIALRDYFAPPSPPGMRIPPFIVIYETPKIGAHYPKVNTPLAQGTRVYNLDTGCLYDPEPIPNLNPPLPASFQIDIEQIRNTIFNRRRP